MKKLKYLITILFLFVGGIIVVNAALPYEEGMKSMTLYTYDGVYTTTKITENHDWMMDVLRTISDKVESEENITPQERVTTVVINYYNSQTPVTIKCYGNNKITIDDKAYIVNSDGDVEQSIINAFSQIIVDNNIDNNGDVSNPQTSDNIIAIVVACAFIAGIAIISYRKTKLS